MNAPISTTTESTHAGSKSTGLLITGIILGVLTVIGGLIVAVVLNGRSEKSYALWVAAVSILSLIATIALVAT